VSLPALLRVPRQARLAAIAGAFLALGCAGRGVEAEDGRSTAVAVDLSAAAATIQADEMLQRIGALSHDSMMGRDTPSPGLEKAAAYLAGEFRALGLEPGGDDGGYLQRYPLPLRALDTTAVHFGSVVGGENRMLAYGTDFFVTAARPFPDAAMGHGQLVWVGRAEAGSLAIGPEVRGQVMAVGVFGGFSRDWRLAVASVRRAAQQAGARALLVVLDPAFEGDAFERIVGTASRPSRSLFDPDEIPVFHLTYEAAGALFERGGIGLMQLPPAPPTAVVVPLMDLHFDAPALTIEEASPPNVVAILRGRDPALRDTYVVFSAHMDHIGVGTADATGDSIHNGADDDASGTSALIEVAEAFAALPEPPLRSLVFLAVSGEEKGLLGSRWFTEHPTIPLDQIVANLNVDMISRNAPDSIVVIGQEYSSLGPLVQRVAADHRDLGLTVSGDLWPEERFFFRSDHFNFAREEIPALFFFAGVHEDYHRPSDEVEKIDGDKAARVARLVFLTAHAIAESVEPPRWTEQGLAEVRALTR
jgi:hypothetical protein